MERPHMTATRKERSRQRLKVTSAAAVLATSFALAVPTFALASGEVDEWEDTTTTTTAPTPTTTAPTTTLPPHKGSKVGKIFKKIHYGIKHHGAFCTFISDFDLVDVGPDIEPEIDLVDVGPDIEPRIDWLDVGIDIEPGIDWFDIGPDIEWWPMLFLLPPYIDFIDIGPDFELIQIDWFDVGPDIEPRLDLIDVGPDLEIGLDLIDIGPDFDAARVCL